LCALALAEGAPEAGGFAEPEPLGGGVAASVGFGASAVAGGGASALGAGEEAAAAGDEDGGALAFALALALDAPPGLGESHAANAATETRAEAITTGRSIARS